jgi:hypothetical protein
MLRPGHDRRRLDAAEFQERRREVHQVDEVVDDPAGLDAGAADDQGDVRAVVVEVALAPGTPGMPWSPLITKKSFFCKQS